MRINNFSNLGTLTLPLCFIDTSPSPDLKANSNIHSEDRPEAALFLMALRRTGNCYYPPYPEASLWQSDNINVDRLKVIKY